MIIIIFISLSFSSCKPFLRLTNKFSTWWRKAEYGINSTVINHVKLSQIVIQRDIIPTGKGAGGAGRRGNWDDDSYWNVLQNKSSLLSPAHPLRPIKICLQNRASFCNFILLFVTKIFWIFINWNSRGRFSFIEGYSSFLISVKYGQLQI
jgi:hypothetical protein